MPPCQSPAASTSDTSAHGWRGSGSVLTDLISVQPRRGPARTQGRTGLPLPTGRWLSRATFSCPHAPSEEPGVSGYDVCTRRCPCVCLSHVRSRGAH